MKGAKARTKPTKRPMKIVLPPWREKKLLDLLEAVVAEAEAGAVLEQELAAEPAAEEEAGDVAGAGHRPGEGDQDVEVDRALAGDGAAEQHHGLAGGDQADEGAGLGEGEEADQEVGPGAERLGDGLEDRLEVEDLGEEVVGDRDRGDDREARWPTCVGSGCRGASFGAPGGGDGVRPSGRAFGAECPEDLTPSPLWAGQGDDRVVAVEGRGGALGFARSWKRATAVGPEPLRKTAGAPVRAEGVEGVADVGTEGDGGGLEVVDDQVDVGERRGARAGGGAQLGGDRVELGLLAAEPEPVGLVEDVLGREAAAARQRAAPRARPAPAAARPSPPPRGPARAPAAAATARPRPVPRRSPAGPRPPSGAFALSRRTTANCERLGVGGEAEDRGGVGGAAAEARGDRGALLDLDPQRRGVPAALAQRRAAPGPRGSRPRPRGRSLRRARPR